MGMKQESLPDGKEVDNDRLWASIILNTLEFRDTIYMLYNHGLSNYANKCVSTSNYSENKKTTVKNKVMLDIWSLSNNE